MPQIDESFEVKQPIDRVWSLFQDISQVVGCMPGAELHDQVDERTYRGRLRMKVGPISADFEGQARIVSIDEASRTGRIEGKGVDRRGGNRGSGTVTYTLSSSGKGTRVELGVNYQLQGRIAQFGRTGVMREISATLTREFAECLGKKLQVGTSEEAAEIRAGEIKGIRLFIRSLSTWLRRLFKRGRS